MTRNLVAVVGTLMMVGAVSADVPLPKDKKYIDPRVKFDGVEKYADHVFYLRFLTFTGGPARTPYTLREVKDGKPFALNAKRRIINVTLLAMNRKEFAKLSKDDASLKWLSDKTEGVVTANVIAPSTVGSADLKEAPVTTYRVELKDGKLSVEMVRDTKRSDAGPLPMWGFGLVLALSIASLGIWFARRRSTLA
ncbi:MAG TPA: hypothetical protein VFE62_18420 [Gemmataceae bacterium]|nr:hypothetical protein [Gemmataceae bacterium]